MDTYYPTGRREEPSKKRISLPAIILMTMFLLIILSLFLFFGGDAAEGIFDLFSSEEKVGDQYALEENTSEETEQEENIETEQVEVVVCSTTNFSACDKSCERDADCGFSYANCYNIDETIKNPTNLTIALPLYDPICECVNNLCVEKVVNDSEQETSQTNISILACLDWDCFITAAANCNPSNFTDTSIIDIFGILVTTTTYYEILGEQEDLCRFKLKTEEQHVDYTDDYRDYLLSSGKTPEEINESLEMGNYVSDLLEGREGACKIMPQDLNGVLTEWSLGNFEGGASCELDSELNWECNYTGDWEVFSECEGEYFNDDAFIHDDPNCKLQVSFSSMSLLKGLSSDMIASGFENADNVSWISTNETVAKVNPSTGFTTEVTAEEIGSTEIIVTDNSVGSHCNISIDFEVF
jgi:hypothetical protein